MNQINKCQKSDVRCRVSCQLSGFSLLELILVIGILVIISGVVSPFLFGGKTSIEVEEEAKKIAGVLRLAQNKAMSREDGLSWGVHFDNITSTEPFYDFFQGNSYTAGTSTERYYLSGVVVFQTPASGTSTAIIFIKRSGSLANGTTTTIAVKSLSPEIIKNVIIYPNGRVNAQ